MRASAPPASAMSASSAGSCMCRSSTRADLYDRIMRSRAAARHRQCRLSRHRTRAGWRRATSTGRATSRRRPIPTRPASASACALDKGDFIGREALAKVKAEGPRRKLVTLTVDGFAPFHGGETILHDGKVVGSVTSGGYGHTLGKTIAFGYVPAALAAEPGFEVIAFGDTWRAARGPRSLYDPKNERLKAMSGRRADGRSTMNDARRHAITHRGSSSTGWRCFPARRRTRSPSTGSAARPTASIASRTARTRSASACPARAPRNTSTGGSRWSRPKRRRRPASRRRCFTSIRRSA